MTMKDDSAEFGRKERSRERINYGSRPENEQVKNRKKALERKMCDSARGAIISRAVNFIRLIMTKI